MSEFYSLKVIEVLPETSEAVTLKFEVPEELLSQFKAIPGQYLKLKARINDKDEERFYSICQIGKNFLRVGIKSIEDGIFSNYACNSVKVGDTIEIMPPQGDFCLPLNDAEEMEKSTDYLFIAAGSGVTPMMSMMIYLLENTEHTKVNFIYVNARRKTIMFFEQLEALKNRYFNRVSITHVLTREPRDLEILSSRPEGDRFKQLLSAFVDTQSLNHTYLCGPLPLIEGFRSALIEKEIDKKNIHLELFGAPTTQVRRKVVRDGTEKRITIISAGLEQVIEVPEGVYILDAAMEAGVDVPYACKGGVCATCKAKMVTGDASMDINYGLEDYEVDDGFVLTCQAHVTSDTAIVDFDVA